MRLFNFPLKIVLAALTVFSNPVTADRVKDIASIQGVRNNQLVGYGLVVGLDGTGDSSSAFTEQSFRTMLTRFGIQVPASTSINIKNVAAVALSAQLPPFAKQGQTIDITVSSMGTAKSLRGGTLLMAPLKGADGNVYAIGQGDLIVSGLGAEGKDGSKVTVNIQSVGRIPNGATVEREVPNPFHLGEQITYNLRFPDFTTAKRLADAINQSMGRNTAQAMDSTSIVINAPLDESKRVEFVSALENIQVTPDDTAARVVVNSRTGTIVIGQHVVVKPAAISHGNLTVTITEKPTVSQPNALAGGQTTVVDSSAIKISKGSDKMFLFQGSTSLQDIVNAVNSVGAAPGDLMAILEALKEIGAIQADIVVI